jgi:hypothetical protein
MKPTNLSVITGTILLLRDSGETLPLCSTPLGWARSLTSHARSKRCRTIMPADGYLASLTKRFQPKKQNGRARVEPGRCELIYVTV